MNSYELLYIVPAQYTDPEIAAIQETISDRVQKAGASVLRHDQLGKIRLAYPIKKNHHGSYILMRFDADTSLIKELDRQLRLSDEIVRHLITERPAEGLDSSYELSSYVAPLSEEARQVRTKIRTTPGDRIKKAEEIIPSAVPLAVQAPAMSMEELDKKLEEILEGDLEDHV